MWLLGCFVKSILHTLESMIFCSLYTARPLLQSKSSVCSIVHKTNRTPEQVRFHIHGLYSSFQHHFGTGTASVCCFKSERSHPGRFLNVSALHWRSAGGTSHFTALSWQWGSNCSVWLCLHPASRPFRRALVSVRNRWRNQLALVSTPNQNWPYLLTF